MPLPAYISALLDEQGNPTQLLSLGCLAARNTPRITRWAYLREQGTTRQPGPRSRV
jgi:hypothetical protein